MKIHFRLAWAKGPVTARHFKSQPCHALFSEYLKRISHFADASASGLDVRKAEPKGPVRWFCHSSKEAKPFSSVELARELEKLRQGGIKEWQLVVGPPDGFEAAHLSAWKPERLWSFGPSTYPHELASVLASEQIYRAFTILTNQPYHSGH